MRNYNQESKMAARHVGNCNDRGNGGKWKETKRVFDASSNYVMAAGTVVFSIVIGVKTILDWKRNK